MMEDNFAITCSSQSLISQKLRKLHYNNIGNWFIKNLNENFHINYFKSLSLSDFMKISCRDDKYNKKRMSQLEMQIDKKKIDDPEFFKNCFEPKPLAEN